MKVRNIDFDFDTSDYICLEDFQTGVENLQKGLNELAHSDTSEKSASEIRKSRCALYDDFMCAILGSDYDETLSVRTSSERQLVQLFNDVLDAVIEDSAAAHNEITAEPAWIEKAEKLKKKANSKAEHPQATPTPVNREQRRAARRNHNKH